MNKPILSIDPKAQTLLLRRLTYNTPENHENKNHVRFTSFLEQISSAESKPKLKLICDSLILMGNSSVTAN